MVEAWPMPVASASTMRYSSHGTASLLAVLGLLARGSGHTALRPGRTAERLSREESAGYTAAVGHN